MFGALNKKLLAAAKGGAMERACPKCGQKFKPFADREFTSWSDFSQPCTCPKCGASLTLKELTRSKEVAQANPEGPFPRPIESRVERRQGAGEQLAFYLPSAGRWGIWVIVPIVWNVIVFPIFLGMLSTIGTKEFKLPATLFISAFAAAGIGIAYAAIRYRYGSKLLELSPETVRLQRTLFGRTKSRALPAAEVQSVSKVQFYSRNYQPVYGIEIDGGRRKIRFGSSLTEDEKNWLCWEIREHLRQHSRRATVSPSVEALMRRS